MSQLKKRSFHLAEDFQPPTKKLISNADLYIKELVKKQQNPVIDLHRELTNPKEFCKGAELLSLSHYNAGASSLEKFQETATHLDNICTLKAAGLADYEIGLYLDYLKGEDYLMNKHKNVDWSSLMKNVNRIMDILLQHQETQSQLKNSNAQQTNNERLDAGLTIKPCSDETKLYKFALENSKLRKKLLPPNTMDNMTEIEESFQKSISVEKLPSINMIRRKARKLFNRIHRVSETNTCVKNSAEIVTKTSSNSNQTFMLQSKWDEKTPSIQESIVKQKQLYTCTSQNYYTITDGTIVKLSKAQCQAKNLPIPENLSIDEIKKIPKFQDYEKGTPSRVLYLRNLSNSVKEIDLKTAFTNYENGGNVIYKIMRGKMRGQAFVTFTDETIASRALDNVNGTFIKNKPVVIQYGYGKG